MLTFKFPNTELSEKYLNKIQQADESQLSLWGQRVLIAQELAEVFKDN